MIEKHNKGYEDYCRAPRLSLRWKVGQLWICDCGKIYVVVREWDYHGSWKNWKAIENKL